MNKNRVDIVDNLPPLRDVIAQYDLRAQKSLGQNFLLDLNVTDKIVREAMNCDSEPWDGTHAVEIGSGPGGLTRALLKSSVDDVSAIEFDDRAVNALRGVFHSVPDFNILAGDALKTDLVDVVKAPRIIVANLPYNIATPLLIGWLRQIRGDRKFVQSMALMFQKEVADRIVAKPNTKTYGRLAVMSQWLCDVHILYDLPPHVFVPAPKVHSAVVFFKPKILSSDAPVFEDLECVTALAFQQRRKMIRSNLKEHLPTIERLGIDPTSRAENLTVSDYIALCK